MPQGQVFEYLINTALNMSTNSPNFIEATVLFQCISCKHYLYHCGKGILKIAPGYGRQIFRLKIQKKFLYYVEVPKLHLHDHFLYHMNTLLIIPSSSSSGGKG